MPQVFIRTLGNIKRLMFRLMYNSYKFFNMYFWFQFFNWVFSPLKTICYIALLNNIYGSHSFWNLVRLLLWIYAVNSLDLHHQSDVINNLHYLFSNFVLNLLSPWLWACILVNCNFLKNVFEQGSRTCGPWSTSGPLGGAATGPWEQPTSGHMCTHILTCASSGWVHALSI